LWCFWYLGILDFGLGVKMEESFGLLQLHPRLTETVFRRTFFLLLDISEREREGLFA